MLCRRKSHNWGLGSNATACLGFTAEIQSRDGMMQTYILSPCRILSVTSTPRNFPLRKTKTRMYHTPRINDPIGFLAVLLVLVALLVESNPITGYYLERCTKELDWVGPGFTYEDCSDAVLELHNLEIVGQVSTPIEFLAPGAVPTRHQMPSRRPPLSYSHGES